MESYKTIESPSEGEFKDKGSKFLAFAYNVTTEEQISEIVQSLKKRYYDARHHCYAWRLTPDGSHWRANDDGEPSSTAGRPILGQMLSNELTDILIVVVRYFGGTKLGVPGLIRAYKSAAIEAISAATIIEKQIKAYYALSFPYIEMNSAMKIVKDLSLEIVNQEFDNRSTLHLSFPIGKKEAFLSRAESIAGVNIDFEGEK